MPSIDPYQEIFEAIEDEVPISAKYKGKFRKLWPVVLGTSPKPGSSGQTVQRVLGFEYELDGAAQSPPVWRCYKVKQVSDITTTTGPTKPVLTAEEVERQSCVVNPDPALPLP